MVTTITGRTIREEAQKDVKTYGVVAAIRAVRLKWLGCILRIDADRTLHKAVKLNYHDRQDGDILMETPDTTCWEDLVKMVWDVKE